MAATHMYYKEKQYTSHPPVRLSSKRTRVIAEHVQNGLRRCEKAAGAIRWVRRQKNPDWVVNPVRYGARESILQPPRDCMDLIHDFI